MSVVTYTPISPNDLLVPPNDVISLSGGGWLGGFDYRIDHSQDVGELFPVAGASNARFFELYDYETNAMYISGNFGFEFRYVLENGVTKTKMIVNTAGNTFLVYITRNGMPQAGFYPYDNTDVNDLSEFYINPGDICRGYASANDNYYFQFVVTDSMLFRYLHYADPEEPATGTEGNSPDDDENDPPPTPVFVPRSARRGNLNFW